MLKSSNLCAHCIGCIQLIEKFRSVFENSNLDDKSDSSCDFCHEKFLNCGLMPEKLKRTLIAATKKLNLVDDINNNEMRSCYACFNCIKFYAKISSTLEAVQEDFNYSRREVNLINLPQFKIQSSTSNDEIVIKNQVKIGRKRAMSLDSRKYVEKSAQEFKKRVCLSATLHEIPKFNRPITRSRTRAVIKKVTFSTSPDQIYSY